MTFKNLFDVKWNHLVSIFLLDRRNVVAYEKLLPQSFCIAWLENQTFM